jgi:iron complex outermembrane recepter protein
MSGRGVGVLAGASLAVLMHAGHALAQSPTTDATAVEEIVVTARREPLYAVRDVTAGALGAKPLLDVPFSITALSEELAQVQRVRTLTELLKNDPSVQNFNFGGNYDYIAIRGFETSTTASYRIDGLQVTTLTDIPFENKERLEVLKGVSGFLFGFAEPGGTVNYVVKRPTAETFLALDAEVREHDGYYGHLDAGGPIQGTSLGYRVNVAGEKVGDFTQNRDLERWVVSAAIDAKLGERLIVRFEGDYQDKQVAANAQVPLTTEGALPPKFDPLTLLGAPWLRYGTRAYNLGFRADYEVSPDWTLTSQWNTGKVERDSAFPYLNFLEPDGDYEVVPFFGPSDVQRQRGWSQQTFLTGGLDTGALRHELVAGVFNAWSRGVFCAYYPAQPAHRSNVFAPTFPVDEGFGPLNRARACPQRNEQLHLFVSDTIEFGDKWRIIAGGRWIDYEFQQFRDNTRYADKVLTPSAAVLYKPRPGATLYVSYAEGLQEGGSAPTNPEVVNAGEQLEPLISTQYEAGAKAVFGRYTITGAVFQIEQPADYVDPTTLVFGRFGERRHRGAELSVAGELTPTLSAFGGVAWLNAEYVQNADPALNGNRPSAIADVQASLFLDWETPVRGFNVSGGVYYVGDRWFDDANTIKVPGHTRVDIGARYVFEAAGRPLTMRVNIDNVFDEHHWESIAYGGLTAGAPRTARLSLHAEF